MATDELHACWFITELLSDVSESLLFHSFISVEHWWRFFICCWLPVVGFLVEKDERGFFWWKKVWKMIHFESMWRTVMTLEIFLESGLEYWVYVEKFPETIAVVLITLMISAIVSTRVATTPSVLVVILWPLFLLGISFFGFKLWFGFLKFIGTHIELTNLSLWSAVLSWTALDFCLVYFLLCGLFCQFCFLCMVYIWDIFLYITFTIFLQFCSLFLHCSSFWRWSFFGFFWTIIFLSLFLCCGVYFLFFWRLCRNRVRFGDSFLLCEFRFVYLVFFFLP